MGVRQPINDGGPWTIRYVTNETRDGISKAAKLASLTVGQWLDKHFADWQADGSPVRVSDAVTHSVTPAAALEMLANMGRAGIPVQKGVGALANRLVRRELRGVLGPAAVKPAPVPQIAGPAEPTFRNDPRQAPLV